MELLDNCWRGLCALADAVKAATTPIERCGLCFDVGSASAWVDAPVEASDFRVWIDLGGGESLPVDEGCALLALDGWARLKVVRAGRVPQALVGFVSLYGVVALAPVLARRLGRAVAISHFAQSLDGRIATDQGDSRWIGDMENRVHAHRMRALCGAILVGSETLRRDRPKLNVRHVEGRDPVRVVLGATAEEAGVLIGLSEAPLWVVGEAPEGAELLMASDKGEWVSPGLVLGRLFERGVESVYVEGGRETTSRFLSEGSLDVVQLHLSPLVLGGGRNSFEIEGIDSVGAAVRFEHSAFFPVGEGMMFVGSGPCQTRDSDE